MGECSTLITKGTTPRDKSGIGVVNFVKVENLVNGDIIPLQKIQLEEHEGYLKRSQLIENDILFFHCWYVRTYCYSEEINSARKY